MNLGRDSLHSRRAILRGAAMFGGAALVAGCARNAAMVASSGTHPALAAADAIPMGALPAVEPAPTLIGKIAAPSGVRPELFRRALAALDWHGKRIPHRDMIVIADFTPSSSSPRFQFVNMHSGDVREILVAHGSGSDPDHSGFLQRFSNVPDSECTAAGSYLTQDYYVGQHGKSQRLMGLDPTNNLAFERAIVIHGAWYANPDMIDKYGKLGRSQGCFAVAEEQLPHLFDAVGQGRLIYANKA